MNFAEVGFACTPGVDPALDVISVQNLSGNNITITSIALSNPNHTFTVPVVLPVVIPGNACQPLVIADSSLLCGSTISDGVATLFFDGFASIDVDLPTMPFGGP